MTSPSRAQFELAVERARELGWYIKVQPGKEGILDSLPLYAHLDLPLVIDHMGRPDASRGVDDANVRKVIELLRRGNVWVMLSNGHKLSRTGKPWSDVVPIAHAYIETAPNRVLWASDWPHPLSLEPPPNDGELLDLCHDYVLNDEQKQQILVDNPAKLFGFSKTT